MDADGGSKGTEIEILNLHAESIDGSTALWNLSLQDIAQRTKIPVRQLAALEAEGVVPESGCRMGICHTCVGTLRYASPESLSLFMYREPKAAKRLYFDVIPRHVDEYQQFLEAYQRQDLRQRLSNPVWHIHSGDPPKADMPITFQLLLTLVAVTLLSSGLTSCSITSFLMASIVGWPQPMSQTGPALWTYTMLFR